jgi:hypothetical protein
VRILRRLELLEAELGEAEHRIVHLLDVLAHRVDFHADVALVLIQLRIRPVPREPPAPAALRGAERDRGDEGRGNADDFIRRILIS